MMPVVVCCYLHSFTIILSTFYLLFFFVLSLSLLLALYLRYRVFSIDNSQSTQSVNGCSLFDPHLNPPLSPSLDPFLNQRDIQTYTPSHKERSINEGWFDGWVGCLACLPLRPSFPTNTQTHTHTDRPPF